VDTIVVLDGIYTCCNGSEIPKPVITSPSGTIQTTKATLQVSGTVTPGLSLALYDNGASNTSPVVGATGLFSGNVLLDFGTNLLTAVQTETGSNFSSAPVAVILAPPAPGLSAPSNSGPAVTFAGSGLPGAVVNLYTGAPSAGTLIATTTNNAAGSFSGMINLADGAYSLAATETINGVASPASAAIQVTVITVGPPTITAPLPGLITNNPVLTVSGTGMAGATVRVYDGASVMGTNFVNSAGKFTLTLKLGNGTNTLTAIQTVSGMAGPSSAAVQVLMTLAPEIVVEPQNQSMFPGGAVVFTSSAIGASPLKYSWQKNGATIVGATATSLTLKNITAASAGSYVMIASNSYGPARSAAAVLTLIPNPFTNLIGNYYGLFSETNAQFQSSGLFTLSLTSLGAYTGKILNAGGSYSFTGAFNPSGESVENVSRGAGKTPLALNLSLDVLNGTQQILGTVSNGTWAASLQADLAVYSAKSPAPEAGNYTLIFGGDSDGSASPGGDGYGKVAVTAAGSVSLTGVLSDNTAVAPSAAGVSKSGQWPLYIPLYGTEGSLSGWVNFTNSSGFSFEGAAAWFRTNSSGKLYPRGFTNTLSIIGSTFSPGGAKIPALAFTNLEITLSQGGLPEPLSNSVALELSGRFLTNGAGVSKLVLSLVPSTGLISGSFSNPATHLSTPIQGVIFQQQTNGAGFFLGPNSTGSFHLSLP
jgi:hypothetical protein